MFQSLNNSWSSAVIHCHVLPNWYNTMRDIYSPTARTGALGRRLIFNQKVLWCKQKILKFFCKRNNKIQGSMMQPLKTSNHLNLSNLSGNSTQIRNVIVLFAKKLKNLLLTGVAINCKQHFHRTSTSYWSKISKNTLIKKMIDWSCFGPEKGFITYCGLALP